MKRFFSFIIVALFVVTLAVPAFASESEFPNPEQAIEADAPYVIVALIDGQYNAWVTAKRFEFNGSFLEVAKTKFYKKQFDGFDWVTRSTNNSSIALTIGDTAILPVWSNYDIYNTDGSIYFEKSPASCDGSSCPATDLDHDNICDDCGNVLVFSLRSTLLEYAYTHLQSGQGLYTNDDYWLITENDEGGYNIYLSNEPFSYGMSTAILSSDGTIHSSSVIVMSTGQNGGRGWQTKTPGTPLPYGNPVASSHDIEGFFPGALWEEMEAVTQGAIVAEQIRLNRTMGVLVTVGVGLVALLVLFRILAKKSLIYRA